MHAQANFIYEKLPLVPVSGRAINSTSFNRGIISSIFSNRLSLEPISSDTYDITRSVINAGPITANVSASRRDHASRSPFFFSGEIFK